MPVAPRLCALQGVPEAPEALRTVHVYPQGYEGVQRSPAHTRLDVALAGAQPGDLIFVYNGHHPGGVTLRTSGTEEAPIVRRRGRRRATSRSEFNLVVDDQQHIFIENLTLRGGCIGVVARGSSHLVVRRCEISNVLFGIYNNRAE